MSLGRSERRANKPSSRGADQTIRGGTSETCVYGVLVTILKAGDSRGRGYLPGTRLTGTPLEFPLARRRSIMIGTAIIWLQLNSD